MSRRRTDLRPLGSFSWSTKAAALGVLHGRSDGFLPGGHLRPHPPHHRSGARQRAGGRGGRGRRAGHRRRPDGRAYANVCGYGEQIDVARQSLAVVQHVYDLTLDPAERRRPVRLRSVARGGGPGADTRDDPAAGGPAPGQPVHSGGSDRQDAPRHPRRRLSLREAARASPRPMPVGDGKALLRRRPDVREAERNLAAATARIGVATADLYPTISIGGAYSGYGTTPGGLVNPTNATYSVGPLLNWSFPNILIARDHIREAGAQAQAYLATFDSTVLTALSDTEQALSTYASEIDHNRALVAAQKAASASYNLSTVQFRAGSLQLPGPADDPVRHSSRPPRPRPSPTPPSPTIRSPSSRPSAAAGRTPRRSSRRRGRSRRRPGRRRSAAMVDVRLLW